MGSRDGRETINAGRRVPLNYVPGTDVKINEEHFTVVGNAVAAAAAAVLARPFLLLPPYGFPPGFYGFRNLFFVTLVDVCWKTAYAVPREEISLENHLLS